jgi:opacity protein-like surface antigen
MNRFLGLCAGFVMLGAAAMAATWSGTVVDTMCKDKDVAGHTRQCALGCAKSGFGLVTSDGKFVKFDESGNAKALAALKASKKDKDLRAKVTGTLNGDVISVESIELE